MAAAFVAATSAHPIRAEVQGEGMVVAEKKEDYTKVYADRYDQDRKELSRIRDNVEQKGRLNTADKSKLAAIENWWGNNWQTRGFPVPNESQPAFNRFQSSILSTINRIKESITDEDQRKQLLQSTPVRLVDDAVVLSARDIVDAFLPEYKRRGGHVSSGRLEYGLPDKVIAKGLPASDKKILTTSINNIFEKSLSGKTDVSEDIKQFVGVIEKYSDLFGLTPQTIASMKKAKTLSEVWELSKGSDFNKNLADNLLNRFNNISITAQHSASFGFQADELIKGYFKLNGEAVIDFWLGGDSKVVASLTDQNDPSKGYNLSIRDKPKSSFSAGGHMKTGAKIMKDAEDGSGKVESGHEVALYFERLPNLVEGSLVFRGTYAFTSPQGVQLIQSFPLFYRLGGSAAVNSAGSPELRASGDLSMEVMRVGGHALIATTQFNFNAKDFENVIKSDYFLLRGGAKLLKPGSYSGTLFIGKGLLEPGSDTVLAQHTTFEGGASGEIKIGDITWLVLDTTVSRVDTILKIKGLGETTKASTAFNTSLMLRFDF